MFLKQAAHKALRLFSLEQEFDGLKARLDLLEKQPRESKKDPQEEPTKLDPDTKPESKTSMGLSAMAVIAVVTGGFIAGLGGYFLLRTSKRQSNAAMYPALMQLADLAKQVLAQKMFQEKLKAKSNVVPLHSRGPDKLQDPEGGVDDPGPSDPPPAPPGA